ncbi:MAG: nucleotidyltransferase family protein [Pyrinomonadaceae bacterium]
MKSSADIFDLLESNRSRLKEFGVREIGVFGSVIRGEHGKASDVDVLVESCRNVRDYTDVMAFEEFSTD